MVVYSFLSLPYGWPTPCLSLKPILPTPYIIPVSLFIGRSGSEEARHGLEQVEVGLACVQVLTGTAEAWDVAWGRAEDRRGAAGLEKS